MEIRGQELGKRGKSGNGHWAFAEEEIKGRATVGRKKTEQNSRRRKSTEGKSTHVAQVKDELLSQMYVSILFYDIGLNSAPQYRVFLHCY